MWSELTVLMGTAQSPELLSRSPSPQKAAQTVSFEMAKITLGNFPAMQTACFHLLGQQKVKSFSECDSTVNGNNSQPTAGTQELPGQAAQVAKNGAGNILILAIHYV